MTIEDQAAAAILVILSGILSMIIGMERERRNKNAGLRTHMLVGIGACLFTVLSKYAFPDSDPSRIAANIVVGIGFLGGGVIFRSGGHVHDLTTAASIWTTAAVGMAVGAGAWFLATISVIVIWFVLTVLWYLRTD